MSSREYDFKNHMRKNTGVPMEPPEVLVIEGLHLFYDVRIRDMLDLRAYVQVDADICILRRLRRDIVERGRTVDSVIRQYVATVKPMYEMYVRGYAANATLSCPIPTSTSSLWTWSSITSITGWTPETEPASVLAGRFPLKASANRLQIRQVFAARFYSPKQKSAPSNCSHPPWSNTRGFSLRRTPQCLRKARTTRRKAPNRAAGSFDVCSVPGVHAGGGRPTARVSRPTADLL